MRAVIQSRKHIFQIALSSIIGVGIDSQSLAVAVEGAHTSSSSIAEGAIVKAVYVELWLLNSAANLGSFTMILYKNPGGSNTATSADMAALHDWDNKKNILYTTQGITPSGGAAGFPMMAYKNWIKIPKGKQRFGLNDKLILAMRNNTTDDLNFCGVAIFKEYT